jgi:hypothetical protein
MEDSEMKKRTKRSGKAPAEKAMREQLRAERKAEADRKGLERRIDELGYGNMLEGREEERVLLCVGYDDCMIGMVERSGQHPIALYDKRRMLEKLAKDLQDSPGKGLENDDDAVAMAEEYFDFNIAGAWAGDCTPAFASLFEDDRGVKAAKKARLATLAAGKKRTQVAARGCAP